jgi:hypothetical protein
MPLPNNNQLDFEKENVDALNSTHTVINSVETLKKLSQPDAHESQISMVGFIHGVKKQKIHAAKVFISF